MGLQQCECCKRMLDGEKVGETNIFKQEQLDKTETNIDYEKESSKDPSFTNDRKIDKLTNKIEPENKKNFYNEKGADNKRKISDDKIRSDTMTRKSNENSISDKNRKNSNNYSIDNSSNNYNNKASEAHSKKSMNKNEFTAKDLLNKSDKRNKSRKDSSSNSYNTNSFKNNDINSNSNNTKNNNTIRVNSKYVNPIDLVSMDKVEIILKNAPQRKKTTLKKMCEYLKNSANSYELTEPERAWLIYKWVGENIEYDFEGLDSGKQDCSEEGTFTKGRSVCTGYARLFNKLNEAVNIESKSVQGYSKGIEYEIGQKFTKKDHEWNSVKINNNWYHIEVTWGSGIGSEEHKFQKKFDPFYFCTNPEIFIQDHFPENPQDQLLKNPINISTYESWAYKKSFFYKYQFIEIIPDSAVLYTNNNNTVEIILKFPPKNKGSKLMCKIFYIQSSGKKNNKILIENQSLITKYNDHFKIHAVFNKKGEYKLELLSGNNDDKIYNGITGQKIICKNNLSPELSYPMMFDNDYFMELIEPIYSNLIKGTEGKFVVKCSDDRLDTLYVNTYGSYIKMMKTNNIFRLENLYIAQNNVSISIKKGDKYNVLYNFNVIENKNNKNISFPECYLGPNNILLSPRCLQLKAGKSYKFKIQSDEIQQIAIINEGKVSFIEKDKNNIFESDVTVKKGQLSISYKKDQPKGSYGTIYLYIVQ